MKDGKYLNVFGFYFMSIFQDFENFLKTEFDLVEDDVRLVLDELNSSFITYELDPGIYNFKDISEAFFNILQSEYPGPSNVSDDITMKTNLVVGSSIVAIRFTKKPFFFLF